MSIRDTTKLACQILGLYTLIQCIGSIPNGIGLFVQMQSIKHDAALTAALEPMSIMFGYSGYFIVLLFIGLFLLFRADPVARRLCRNTEMHEVQSHWTAEEIQAVAFSIIGLYILMTAIPDATRFTIQILSKFIAYKDISPSIRGEGIINDAAWGDIGWLASKTTVGLWLVLGARGLSRLATHLRNRISK
jgi:hypothetical protein